MTGSSRAPRSRIASGGSRSDSTRSWPPNERRIPEGEDDMAVERVAGGTSLIDVLDRVLDKGVVIHALVRISLVGIDLITVEARVVVASIDTYLKYSEAVGLTPAVSRPPLTPRAAGPI